MKKSERDPKKVELAIRMLLRNALTSKSGVTLADTDVLEEIAKRLGYSTKDLLDTGADHSTFEEVKYEHSKKRSKTTPWDF